MNHHTVQIRAGILYLTATLLDSFVPFLTLPIFTRILTSSDFGVLALAQVFALLIGSVATFGLATAYNRNYFEVCDDKKKTGELFFTIITFVAVLSLILTGVTCLFQNELALLIAHSSALGPLFLWALIANILVNLRLFFLAYLRNSERPGQYVFNTMMFSLINLGASLFFVMIAKVGVIGIVYGQALASGLILGGLLFQFLRELPWGWNTKLLVDALKIGSPTVPMAFFSTISTHFDKYLLGLLASLDGVGIYSIGQKIAMLNFTFMTSLQNVFSPVVYKKMFTGTEESRLAIGQYLLPFFYIICFCGLGIVLFSEEILTVMAPPAFSGAADIIILLTLFYSVLFFAKINGDQLIFAKKTYLTTLLLIGTAILNILINIPFIQQWGAPGAAGATFLARALAGIVIFKVAQKFFRIIWPVKPTVMIFGILFFAAIGLLMLRHFLVCYQLRLLYKIFVFGLYLFLGKSIGFLTIANFKGLLDLSRVLKRAN